MKAIFRSSLPLLLVPFLMTACSDPKEAPLGVQERVQVHTKNWLNKSAADFHGAVLAARQFDMKECQQCHGNQFDGGIVGVSCFTCHAAFPHGDGWTGVGEGSHSRYIQTNAYDFSECTLCHGQNYDVPKNDQTCRTCHTSDDGPEACTTCHGSFGTDPTNLENVAPPAGLENETATTEPAVGAHQEHIEHFGADFACQQCHAVPAAMRDAGHIDADGMADVLLSGALATLATEGGARVPAPAYDFASNSCQNAYCHGNWGLLKATSTSSFIYAADKIEGNTATPVWVDPATAACGTCHDLPPKGHLPRLTSECTFCHSSVVDAELNFIDETKHVNGKINVFGQELPMNR